MTNFVEEKLYTYSTENMKTLSRKNRLYYIDREGIYLGKCFSHCIQQKLSSRKIFLRKTLNFLNPIKSLFLYYLFQNYREKDSIESNFCLIFQTSVSFFQKFFTFIFSLGKTKVFDVIPFFTKSLFYLM